MVLGDKDPSAVVSVPDNLLTTPTVTPTSVGVGNQHILMAPGSPPTASTSGAMAMGGAMTTGGSRPDEEEIGESSVNVGVASYGKQEVVRSHWGEWSASPVVDQKMTTSRLGYSMLPF